jgi:hypothetical protein
MNRPAYTETEAADFRRTFVARRTRQMRLGVLVLIAVLLLLFSQIARSSNAVGLGGLVAALVAVGLILGALGFSLVNWRCPACGHYLGRSNPLRFCAHCGLSFQPAKHVHTGTAKDAVQYSEQQVAAFHREFTARRKRQQFLLIPAFAAVGGLMWIRAADNPTTVIGVPWEFVALACFVVLLAGARFSLANWRCPACHWYLGEHLNLRFCQRCGISLR